VTGSALTEGVVAMSDMVGLCCCGGDGGGGGGGGGEETIGDWRFVCACREWGAQQFQIPIPSLQSRRTGFYARAGIN
jgi:hypothetical protein